jgi:hypothetical protein
MMNWSRFFVHFFRAKLQVKFRRGFSLKMLGKIEIFRGKNVRKIVPIKSFSEGVLLNHLIVESGFEPIT